MMNKNKKYSLSALSDSIELGKGGLQLKNINNLLKITDKDGTVAPMAIGDGILPEHAVTKRVTNAIENNILVVDTVNVLSSITASGSGAFAMGKTTYSDGTSTYDIGNVGTINSTGKGSLAFGFADLGKAITAGGDNSIQFGPGINNLSNSLQVGTTIRIDDNDGYADNYTGEHNDIFKTDDGLFINNNGTVTRLGSGLVRPSGADYFYGGETPVTGTQHGSKSLDIQVSRTDTTHSASALDAIAIGSGVSAQGISSIAIGKGLTNITPHSMDIGLENTKKISIYSDGSVTLPYNESIPAAIGEGPGKILEYHYSISKNNNDTVINISDDTVIQTINLSDIARNRSEKEDKSQKNVAGGYVGLGQDALIERQYLPPLVLSETYTAADETEMFALTANRGDVVIRTDISKTFIVTSETLSGNNTLDDFEEFLTPDAPVFSVNGKVGVVTLTAADIGAVPAGGGSDDDGEVPTVIGGLTPDNI